MLRHRDFRLLWLGLVGSAIGTWMQIVAQALMVLELSHGSALALGAVSLAQALAFFAFSLFGGAVADHVDKRRLLLTTQTICMSLAALLALLTWLHVVAVWMVVVLAFLQGTALSFDQPTRAALVPELVPKEELLNAVSLQSIVFTGASTLGPALAGLDHAGARLRRNLLRERRQLSGDPRRAHRDPSSDGRRADRALRPHARSPTGSRRFAPTRRFRGCSPCTARSCSSDPRRRCCCPSWGRACCIWTPCGSASCSRRPARGPSWEAWASRRSTNPSHKARILLTSAVLWALALFGFAMSRSFAPALGALLLCGVFQVGVSATTITLLQTRVPRHMSGRVMSINTLLIMGVRPLGDFLAAAVIGRVGAPFTATASAVLVAALALAVATRRSTRTA